MWEDNSLNLLHVLEVTSSSLLPLLEISGFPRKVTVVSLSCIWLFATSLTVAHQAPLSAPQVAVVAKNPPAMQETLRDTGSIPGLGRSPGGGHGNPL